MSMTEATVTEAPKKTRKPAKKRARSKTAKSPAPPQDSAYRGITPSDCPIGCTAERCVISYRGICAHPYKGGLQASMQSPDAIRRLNEAKRVIGKRKLDIAAE